MSVTRRPANMMIAWACLCFLSGGLIPYKACQAAIYNAVDDFSNTTNTLAATWSYRFSSDTIRDGLYPLLPTNSDAFGWSPSTPYWNLGTGPNTPGVGVNRSGGNVTGLGVTWPDDTLWMHPSGLAVVSWLAPSTGIYNIDFSFRDLDAGGGNGVLYFVDRNNALGQLAAGTLSNGASTGPLSLTNVLIGAGDRINFIVDSRANNSDFDSTAFTAQITAVPEPASLILFSTALGLFALARRCRSS